MYNHIKIKYINMLYTYKISAPAQTMLHVTGKTERVLTNRHV